MHTFSGLNLIIEYLKLFAESKYRIEIHKMLEQTLRGGRHLGGIAHNNWSYFAC